MTNFEEALCKLTYDISLLAQVEIALQAARQYGRLQGISIGISLGIVVLLFVLSSMFSGGSL